MKKNAWKLATAAVIAAGVAIAQGPGYGRWGANPQTGSQSTQDFRLERLTQLLSLDAGQQAQAKAIFDKESADSQALQPSLVQAQTNLHNAIRTGKGIDTLSAGLGTILGQMHAIHTTAMAQFYNILTPAQKDQFDKYQGAGLCMGLGDCPGAGLGMGRGMGMMHGSFGPRQ